MLSKFFAQKIGRYFGKTQKMLKGEGGSALMIALFTVTLLMVAAMEIVYESNVEFLISSQQVNQIKAYYAAKSGVEISLLRIHIYKKALAMFGKQIPDPSMLDMIWNTPFAWPPPVPDNLNAVDKDTIKSSVKNSSMHSNYMVSITSEGYKIDLNDLASPSESLKKASRKLILQVFTSKIEADQNSEDPWVKAHRDDNFEELVNNIADWVDADSESINGGAENRFYRNSGDTELPPNRPFQSVNELHMVAGMTDELYDVLAPRVTVYGTKSVNVNYAPKETLMALDPAITSEIADKIIESRNDPNRGPFKNLEDFVGFLTPLGVPGSTFVDTANNNRPTVPLVFGSERNFKIVSVGNAGKVNRKITALVYDFDAAKGALKDAIKADHTPDPTASVTPTPTATAAASPTPEKPPTDRPNVVYWLEE